MLSVESPLQACLIANRGEIAVRIIRACRVLGIRTCAVYSDADADALHVQLADAARPIGPAEASESYLNMEALLWAAADMGCDCVHPGYGFLSENEAFARAVSDAGLIWIGPSVDALRIMGSKTEARALMREVGVPVVPGFQPDDAADSVYLEAARRIGWPVLVKAAGGGGGRGMRVVEEGDQLADALRSARREAEGAFGSAHVFLEKYIEAGRHIEVQVFGDHHGNVIALSERDCSAQRRHQKIVEEAPAPGLDAATREALAAAAVKAAQAVKYVGAGTVEFLLTPQQVFYFLEMNTRLQVEHPVTEQVTGIDLVLLQFAVAAGEVLPFAQADVQVRGHAIEARIYAEDASTGFLPAPGPLLRCRLPSGPGIRVETAVREGDFVQPFYDPLIAKVIATGRSREEALARMDAALADTIILGTPTNVDFVRTLIGHRRFRAGDIDTGFVERERDLLLRSTLDDETLQLALIAAALDDAAVPPKGNGIVGDAPLPVDPWDQTDAFRVSRGNDG